MKNVGLDTTRRLLLQKQGAEFTGNFHGDLPYAVGVGRYMVLPREGGGERYLVLPKMAYSRQRTRWPNRQWSGPHVRLNKLGLMDKEMRQEGISGRLNYYFIFRLFRSTKCESLSVQINKD